MKGTLRDKNILTTVECYRLLNRGDFARCLRAGWIQPCVQMPTPKGFRARYSRADLERCEARLAAGEQPGDRSPLRCYV